MPLFFVTDSLQKTNLSKGKYNPIGHKSVFNISSTLAEYPPTGNSASATPSDAAKRQGKAVDHKEDSQSDNNLWAQTNQNQDQTLANEQQAAPKGIVINPKMYKKSTPSSVRIPKKTVLGPEKFTVHSVTNTALADADRENAYTSSVRKQKDRIVKIRAAMKAATVIQRAWRNYKLRRGRKLNSKHV